MNSHDMIINNSSKNKSKQCPRLEPKDALGHETRNRAMLASNFFFYNANDNLQFNVFEIIALEWIQLHPKNDIQTWKLTSKGDTITSE